MKHQESARPPFLPLEIVITLVVLAASAFAASPAEKVLYSFQGGADGAGPIGKLIADAAGNLYGVTSAGGVTNCAGGCGTIFQLSPPQQPGGSWTETVLYRFTGGTDGAGPSAGMIFDQAGNLYGPTLVGGDASFNGTVFELSPPTTQGGAWTETIIYRFQGGNDGEYPRAELVFDQAGNLYGTTFFGGSSGAGIVFQLTPPTQGDLWTETVLHTFHFDQDGGDPQSALLLDPHGALYGSTFIGGVPGGGVVFKLKPPAGGGGWTEKVLYGFNGQRDGDQLSAGALLAGRNGTLYGAANLGGSLNSGTVFSVTPPGTQGGAWTETTLHTFARGDGIFPLAGLVADQSGNLYGVTQGGGQGHAGTAFRLTPPQGQGDWTLTTLHAFRGGSDGAGPSGGLTPGKHGELFGVTASGGSSSRGTVYQIVP